MNRFLPLSLPFDLAMNIFYCDNNNFVYLQYVDQNYSSVKLILIQF